MKSLGKPWEQAWERLGKLEKCGVFMVIKLYKMDFMDISWEYDDLTKKNVGFHGHIMGIVLHGRNGRM